MHLLWQRLVRVVPKRSQLLSTTGVNVCCRASPVRSYAAAAFDKKSIQQSAKQWKQKLQGNDIVFYRAPEGVGRTFTFMYISAGVQLLFWGNLASLAYVTYSKKESDAEDAPVVLAPKGQRMAIAAGLVSIGVGIAAVMCTYPWRYIDKLVLLRGGNIVRMVTHARFANSHKIKEYPIDRLYCKQQVHTGIGRMGTENPSKSNSTHIFLRAQGEKMAYMLDRKGVFTDSKMFDGLWYEPRGR